MSGKTFKRWMLIVATSLLIFVNFNLFTSLPHQASESPTNPSELPSGETNEERFSDSEVQELLSSVFLNSVIEDIDKISSPVQSLSEVSEWNDKLTFPAPALISLVSDDAQIAPGDSSRDDLTGSFTLPFKVETEASKDLSGAAHYFLLGNPGASRVAVIVPGSGDNEASKIQEGDGQSYHCCLAQKLVKEGYLVVTIVAPNEDFRALWAMTSAGPRKLSPLGYVNWHLNRNSSISARTIAEISAVVQHFKRLEKEVSLIGISQGGELSLVASQIGTPPDNLVIASGYSEIFRSLVFPSGHNQMIIPGIEEFKSAQAAIPKLDGSRVLFTYGVEDASPLYRLEVQAKICEFLSKLPSTLCAYHAGGHEFPEEIIVDFLRKP